MIGSICFFPFAGKTRSDFLSVLPVVSFIVGWITAVLGQAMDARTYRRLTGLQLTPKQARGEKEALEGNPALINTDPFGEGWIFMLKMDAPEQVKQLKDAAGYRAAIG